MSQNRHKNPEFKPRPQSEFKAGTVMSFERIFYTMLLVCLAGIFIFAASNAQAAVTATKTAKNPTYILKSSLSDMSKRDSAILDWRTQEYELAFDLPANDWYESLDLFISAYPEGQVAQGTPLLISYNGAKPVPIYGRASRFDAHIRMDTSRIRLSRNSIKISYQTPRNADCLTPANGQWVIDLSRSKLVAKARAKNRQMNIAEIEQRLAHAMTAPKRVGITAIGSHKLAYEALAAQGIAQRMSFIPEFKLGSGLSDMQFIIGTHDDIRPLLNDKSILDTQGAKVLIDSGHKPQIVLTAETEEQVLELVRAFATYHLPKARRGSISMHELYSGALFAPQAIVSAGHYKLSDIGTPVIAPTWRPDVSKLNFNVVDPHATSGVLTLKVLSAKDINPQSRLSVKLNGQAIGYTHLNKSSKLVEFNIKPGMFTAVGNTLTIAPDIQPSGSATVCQSQQYVPTVLVSNASKFRLTTSRSSHLTDLSRLAASGAPFDNNSTLVLTGRTLKDRLATLNMLAYAAQQFGPKWTGADYVSELPAKSDLDRNILIIGPNPIIDSALYSAAPKGLKIALGKTIRSKQKNLNIVDTDRFASSNAEQTFKLAAGQDRGARLDSGGLAAMFPSPYANGRMVGIISSDRPAKFASALNAITTNNYWNGLQGSVARWDKNTILMAQTATPLPASFGLSETAPKTTMPKFVGATKTWFANRSWGTPKQAVTGLVNQSTPVPTPVLAQPNNTILEQIKPVQTASNNPRIGMGRPLAQPPQLRGSAPVLPTPPIAAPKKNWTVSMPKFAKPSLPNMTEIKLKGYQTKRDLQAWWGKTSSQVFKATPLRQWWEDITHNRAAFFLLIVFFGFLVAALASPMSIRKKKR
ncbi:MAG: cellulose biosynthesis cyclic di-GMP-binding regulatory protein BcsB [Robiginitomaculum sp.]|nr:cellulose biosynthesis cyclic di-GMP-binding regulatory protein BcsB [Robiginitomaculum sp.]